MDSSGSGEANPLSRDEVRRAYHSVTLNGLDGDAYFIDLKDALKRDVGMNVPLAGSLNTLGLGATSLSVNQCNFIPATCGEYVDAY